MFAAPGQELLDAEQRAAARSAMAALPDRHRQLMNTLLASPAPTYADVAAALEMPLASIGPTRGRAIRHVRRHQRIHSLAS